MTAALPAFLIEAIFYLGSGFEQTRTWFARIRPPGAQAAILWISALLPFLIFSLGAGTFQRNTFYLLCMLCAVFAFWYVVLPHRIAYDVGFLIIGAAPIVLRVFQRVYFAPDNHIRVDVLGHLMWIRLGIAALLILRGWDPGAFSFWPRRAEWKTGMVYYFLVLIPIVAVAIGVRDVRFAPLHQDWWRVTAILIETFFGILWVVAFGEELFFRGVIERGLLNGWHSPAAAVLISALIFGAAHLWFRHFPDWRRAAVTTVLGIGCGLAYLKSGSVRAPMVTHAFVVVTWRMFFK